MSGTYEGRVRQLSRLRLYQGLTDEQRIALAAALERVQIIEGARPRMGVRDERLSDWFLQRTPTIGTPISLRLVKRDPGAGGRITQVIQICGGVEHNPSHIAPDGKAQERRLPRND